MIFNSFQFLWLFPIIFIIYYGYNSIFNKNEISKSSNYLLLFISYLIYSQWNPAYTLILLGVTLCTYYGAIFIENKSAHHNKKCIVTIFAILTLLPLIIFKYYNFITENVNLIFEFIGIKTSIPGINLALPIGLSFFSFQAVGYLWDVYYNKIKAERNLPDYMLFVAFFPQIISGPISKASTLLPQIKAKRVFDYNKAVQGLKWLLWGFFLKTVMADRLGLYVDTVYGNYEHYSGLTCFVASIFYSFQIYGDFAGYSLMAIGVGRLLGFDLINNFNRPYFAASITEFWHRWHISLSTWLKDYIYIPLGGSRCSKIRSYWNIFVTFLVSGIWHGANWTFIIWGSIHGFIQILEKVFGLQKTNSKGIVKSLRILATFMIVNFAWIFFRMPTIETGYDICSRIVLDFMGELFIDLPTMCMGLFAVVIVFMKELCEEYFPNLTLFNNKSQIIRWTTYTLVLILIILLGVFDSSQFIYANF